MVADNGVRDTIPRSIQLAAGRTGQEYNQRKGRKGAFWEEPYHVTAIAFDDYLFKCMVSIDEVTTGKLGMQAKGRRIIGSNKSYELHEPAIPYRANLTPENGLLRLQNTYNWDDIG